MNYTFESTKPDGSPRKFVGMWTPPFDDWVASLPAWETGYRPTYAVPLRERWLNREGDRPLYEDDDDATQED